MTIDQVLRCGLSYSCCGAVVLLFAITLRAAEPTAKGPVSPNSWNSLLQQHIDLHNKRLKVERGEIKVDDLDQFLVEQRTEEESLAAQFVRLAENEPGNPVAYFALQQAVLGEYSGKSAERAAELLIRDHVGDRRFSEHCRQLAFSLPASLAAEQVLRGAIEKSTSQEVIAQSCVSLGSFLRKQTDRAKMMATLPSRRSRLKTRYGEYYIAKLEAVEVEAAEREAEMLLLRATKEFASVGGGVFGERLTADAQTELGRLHNLSIGRQAQEIEGQGIDGRMFRLSEFQGKVRVLLFWGHWCGPCQEHYPVYRKLVEQYTGQPFAFLGINSDSATTELQELVRTREITWKFCWDGSQKPWPIHTQWGLYGSAWTFVLDREGRIRFSSVYGPELEEAVAVLMRNP